MQTTIELITRAELLDLFDESVHEKIETLLTRDDVDGLVICKNLNMSSPHLGEVAAVAYGPGCTYKKRNDLEDKVLGTAPSTFQYPQFYYQKGAS